jgi:glyceraldehyde-3-phosphate dehydrogenase/erythrose-4-phosphate dehydrogenase
MSTVAITGLGRIARAALEILLDGDGLDVVAVKRHRRRWASWPTYQEYEAPGATDARTS